MDLNLVRVFTAVYESRSLTRAGERLFVTQSAVSQSLSKLRTAFDDPLFERSGRGVRPTSTAHSIYPSLRDSLLRIDQVLERASRFDPAETDRVFRIALPELGEIGWIASIHAAVHRTAPRARLEVRALDQHAASDWLARGDVDVVITSGELPPDFERTSVKSLTYGVVLGHGHPLFDHSITLDDYRAGEHVQVAADAGAPRLPHLPDMPTPALIVQRYAAIPQVLMRSPHLIATVPLEIASGWARHWPLTTRPLPFAVPPIALHLYRRSATHHSGALAWFHSTVADVVRRSAGEFAAIAADDGEGTGARAGEHSARLPGSNPF